MTKVPTVRDIMIETQFSLSPDMDAFKAVDMMVAKNLAGTPVLDGEGNLVGFITEKDCLRLLAVSHQYNMTGRKVRDIMSAIKGSLHPDMDLLTAAMHFISCNFATLPVIEAERLIGSISRHNMLQAIQNFHNQNGRGIKESQKALQLMENPSSIEEFQSLVARSSNNAQLAAVLARRHVHVIED